MVERRRSLDRLKAVVAAYGARPDRWPDDEREALERLAASHRDEPFLADEAVLDRLLDAVPGDGLAEGLAERVVAAAAGEAQDDTHNMRLFTGRQTRRPAWRPHLIQAAALAASLVAGVWLGAAGLADAWLPEPGTLEISAVAEDEANLLAAVDADGLSL